MSTRDILRRLVTKLTADWATEVFGADPVAPDDIPTQMQAILGKVSRVEGARNKEVLEALTDKIFDVVQGTSHGYLNREAADDSIELTMNPYTCVVPVNSNGNSHDYPMGRPAVSLGTTRGGFLREDGSRGNDLSIQRRYLRPATEEEIADFFNKLDEEGMRIHFHSALMAMQFGREQQEEVADVEEPTSVATVSPTE